MDMKKVTRTTGITAVPDIVPSRMMMNLADTIMAIMVSDGKSSVDVKDAYGNIFARSTQSVIMMRGSVIQSSLALMRRGSIVVPVK